jgi:hypothetical protein
MIMNDERVESEDFKKAVVDRFTIGRSQQMPYSNETASASYLCQINPFQTLIPYFFKIQFNTVKPVLNGISRAQNIFPLKPGYAR